MKYFKYLLFLLLLIVPFNVKAIGYHFEESDNIISSGNYFNCIQEDAKVYCIYNPDYTSEYSQIHEIDLDTLNVRVIKQLNTSDIYATMIKTGDNYIAVGYNAVERKISAFILNQSFDVIRELPIANGGYYDTYEIKEINGYYYVLSDVFNNTLGSAAFQIYPNLTTNYFVELDNLNGEEYEYIRNFDEICNLIKSIDSSRYLRSVTEYNGGYLIEHSTNSIDKEEILFYKNHEIKWEKKYDGFFAEPIIKNNNILVLNENTNAIKTMLDEYSEDGNLVNSYPIDNINNQGRLFLSNQTIAYYNNKYYFLTYKPSEVLNYSTWSDWRITTMSKVNLITNKDGDSIVVKDYALPGDEVTINVDKNKAKLIDRIIVKDENGNEIPVINYKFIMPNSDITVEVLYKNTINPNTGRNIIIIVIILVVVIGSLIIYLKKKKK